jgi:hypothetical protein
MTKLPNGNRLPESGLFLLHDRPKKCLQNNQYQELIIALYRLSLRPLQIYAGSVSF